ncbi:MULTISPECIES: glycosyltransferase [unclassified Pseudodesulfovibrio]|uniref:glycosyltransferase n=1 Tax=unclassified Pseudodesulfovibrio TaxID=2661612 RepID=UPI000FEBA363|nr:MULTISPECIES: glycosyltransferase [unclassified Pseudodesulfovibrio]MCJ2164074.1 glycosyltransferase [Pseudodesulfovibrio sp. S3-i]RWU05295.1 glycosyltransferase [Pseudodesulfovibrio sp. S3]
MRKSTVSIIISDLETHASLPRLLLSISRQSTGLDAMEIIIAGNGGHAPTDPGVWQAITGMDSIRLQVFDRSTTPSQARNRAAAMTTGEILVFLRPDYRLDPKFMTTTMTVLEDHPETDIVYADYIRLAPKNDRSAGPGMVQLPKFRDGLLQARGFLGPGVLLTRRAWESTAGFRDNTFYRDWDLWIQASLAGSVFYHVNYPLASCEHRKISFRERAEDGRCKAIIVINNSGFFHEHTVRWALAYLRGDAWAEAYHFMSIPGPMDVTHMLHDYAMRTMGTDLMAEQAIRQFDQAVMNSDTTI